MSCLKSNSPIDISPTNVKGDCSLKCKYSFNYGDSFITIKNKKKYLSLGYDNSNTNVIFNGLKMQVSEIRVFSPSLHTFDGNKSDAEMIIIHQGFGKNLLVCIPINHNSSKDSVGNNLELIINKSASNASRLNEETQISSTKFNLNDFVPEKEKFFSYVGNYPYEPCSGNVNYVVFHQTNNYIPIGVKVFNKLKTLLNDHNTTIKKGPNLYLNNGGPSNISGTDEIYISCKPTGDEGEELVKKRKDFKNIPTSQGITFEEFMKSPSTLLIIGIISSYLLFEIGKRILSKLKINKPQTVTIPVTPTNIQTSE